MPANRRSSTRKNSIREGPPSLIPKPALATLERGPPHEAISARSRRSACHTRACARRVDDDHDARAAVARRARPRRRLRSAVRHGGTPLARIRLGRVPHALVRKALELVGARCAGGGGRARSPASARLAPRQPVLDRRFGCDRVSRPRFGHELAGVLSLEPGRCAAAAHALDRRFAADHSACVVGC